MDVGDGMIVEDVLNIKLRAELALGHPKASVDVGIGVGLPKGREAYVRVARLVGETAVIFADILSVRG